MLHKFIVTFELPSTGVDVTDKADLRERVDDVVCQLSKLSKNNLLFVFSNVHDRVDVFSNV